MLVLTRKNQEAVMIGGSGGFDRLLKVTVLEIRAGKVRLGFEGDADVPIHRLEVWQQIQTGRGPPDSPAGNPVVPVA
jgi:carbon storage regulator CsrA